MSFLSGLCTERRDRATTRTATAVVGGLADVINMDIRLFKDLFFDKRSCR